MLCRKRKNTINLYEPLSFCNVSLKFLMRIKDSKNSVVEIFVIFIEE